MTSRVFQHRVRIYFADTDAGGIVYHANYLRFMEQARGEMLRELGYSQGHMLSENAPLIVVSRMDIHYCKPAKLDDDLVIETRIKALRHASAVFEQTVLRGDEILTQANVRCAAIDPEKGRPVQMHGPLYEAMAACVEA